MATPTKAELPSVVRTIEDRVESLIVDHKRLRNLNREVIAQRDALRADKRELMEKVAKLEKELALSELQSGLAGSSRDKQRAKAYINRLMREVDSCLTLLSSPGAE